LADQLTVNDGLGTAPVPFELHVADDVLGDLADRLNRTRIAPGLPDDGWKYGFSGEYLRELVGYWRRDFDWRAQEKRINELSHFKVLLDGLPIHFVHRRGRGPRPMPLILTHGWPWTFWDFNKVMGPLSDPEAFGGRAEDAFDVVVPSLPGYVFSTPLPRPGINFWTTADLWVRLMRDVLGYERFAAHGDDWGFFVTAQLGHKYAEHLYGIHLTGVPNLSRFNLRDDYRPWTDLLSYVRSSVPPKYAVDLAAWERARAAHLAVQMSEPQTLAQAVHDSPSGMAAWLLQRRRTWSDCNGDLETRFTKDELLTTAMLYWVTDSFASAARYYFEAVECPWSASHDRVPMVETPTGVTVFARDRPPGFRSSRTASEDYFNLTLWTDRSSGGHFGPMEEPDAIVEDIRATFRPMRDGLTRSGVKA
jgi:pimeloyl-ACP methyl ester carboxylesterase